MENVSSIFDSAFLKKIEQLKINTQMLMNTNGSGSRKSRSKGSSVEFSDYREYADGDDFRRIDWNAYGRFEKLYVKLYMEEREARVNIFLDISKSMNWGNPHKGTQAKRLAAALGYIALSNFDRVSIYAVNSKLSSCRKSMHAKAAFWEMLRFLEELPYYGTTTLNAGIKEFDGSGGSGISFVISDLMSTDGVQDAIKYLQYHKQDVVLCHLLAPQEVNPPLHGSIRLVDVETGEVKDITVTHRLLQSYQTVLNRFIDDFKEFSYKRGLSYVQLSTDTGVDSMIKKMIGVRL